MDIFKETFKNILDWSSDKIEGHESQFYATAYIVLFVIGVLLLTLTPGKMPWYEFVFFVVLFPIVVACFLLSLISFIAILYKIIVALLKYIK